MSYFSTKGTPILLYYSTMHFNFNMYAGKHLHKLNMLIICGGHLRYSTKCP